MNLVDYKINYENWCNISLPKGITIRLRPTITALLDNGPGNYGLKLQNQLQVLEAEPVKRTPHPKTKRLGEVDFTVMGDASSSYETVDQLLRVSTRVRKVYRTDGVGADGEPIFQVDTEHDIQVINTANKPGSPAPPRSLGG